MKKQTRTDHATKTETPDTSQIVYLNLRVDGHCRITINRISCTRDPLQLLIREGRTCRPCQARLAPLRNCRTLCGGNDRRDRRPPETVLRQPALDCRRGSGYAPCVPDLILGVCAMHPETTETMSLARNLLARATSLVAERGVQVGWELDNGGRWPAPLAAPYAPRALYMQCNFKSLHQIAHGSGSAGR